MSEDAYYSLFLIFGAVVAFGFGMAIPGILDWLRGLKD